MTLEKPLWSRSFWAVARHATVAAQEPYTVTWRAERVGELHGVILQGLELLQLEVAGEAVKVGEAKGMDGFPVRPGEPRPADGSLCWFFPRPPRTGQPPPVVMLLEVRAVVRNNAAEPRPLRAVLHYQQWMPDDWQPPVGNTDDIDDVV